MYIPLSYPPYKEDFTTPAFFDSHQTISHG
jgi:hypothetical protein